MLKKILHSKYLPYIGELFLPTILSFLFVLFLDSQGVYNSEEISFAVCSLFFFITIAEWYRRFKNNTNKGVFKYAYIVLMVIVFILGIWYVGELGEY